MQSDTKIALGFCGFFVGLLVLSALFRSSEGTVPFQAVSFENGVQIITITANGGFSPEVVTAYAGLQTELHIITNGTYDCSASVVIPSLAYKKILPATGTEVIEISANHATGTLQGACGMGMYTFEIVFSEKG